MPAHHARTRRFAAGTAALLAALVGSSLVTAPPPAAAAPIIATSGTVTWGVKQSFRSYIVSPGAAGTITVAGGATQAPSNGAFTFPADAGQREASTANIDTRGSVRFLGHEGVLDVTLSDIRVTVAGSTGTLVVDAATRSYAPGASTPGAVETYDDVVFATLDLTLAPPIITGTSYAASNVPATLTAAGVPVLAGFYTAGTALDPVSVSMALETVPTCIPGTPAVTTATGTTVTLTIAGGSCPTSSAWRVFIYEGASSSVSDVRDVPAGAKPVVAGLAPGKAYRFAVAARTGAGIGPGSGGSGVAAPPFTNLAAFTSRQHLDFRLRPPTAAERTAWITSITQGTQTPLGAVDQAVDFPEWAKQSPMIRLFQAYFLRLPDIGGLDYWTRKSRSGTRINAISASFASSSEFTRRYGKLSNRAFVELVYQNVLGRPGDAAGIRSWTGKLDARTKTRGEVMVGFSESNEYKTKTRALTDVVNVYTGMLRRTPTAAENAEWQPRLKSGTPRSSLVATLLASAAYDTRVG